MGKLVLTRKVGESILIGEDIIICIEDVDRKRVRVSIQAPRETTIVRTELVPHRMTREVKDDEAAL